MYKNITGLAATVEQTVMTAINQSGKALFYLLSISSKVLMKSTIGTSIIGGNLMRTKSDFLFVRLVSP